MAIPSLAAMAALTLFHNPHMQPEGVSVDYTPYAAPATVIQRTQRRRRGAVTRIAAAVRGWMTRTVHIGWKGIGYGLNPSRMRSRVRDLLFTWPYNNAMGSQFSPLLRRRRNMLDVRASYRSRLQEDWHTRTGTTPQRTGNVAWYQN